MSTNPIEKRGNTGVGANKRTAEFGGGKGAAIGAGSGGGAFDADPHQNAASRYPDVLAAAQPVCFACYARDIAATKEAGQTICRPAEKTR